MNGKNETSQQTHSSKQLNVAANKLNDIPAALQEDKNHLGGAAAENIMERIKMAERKNKNQNNDVERASHKQKSENNEKLAVQTEETMLETGNPLMLTALSHIPLKSLSDIETKLVYVDEDNIFLEFDEPMVFNSRQSGYHDSAQAHALNPPDSSTLPHINKQLQMTLLEASTCYKQKNYAAAVEQLSTAMELFSKGAAIENPYELPTEDLSSIASFIETKFVICYLKLRKPDEALNHSHRSIILNPSYFRNHLRQAAVFRCLERYSEAARSAMVADYIYWLTGGTEQHISKLIKLYWQAMIEEAITREASFSVMYTPLGTEIKADERNELKTRFAKKHPDYVEHIYTDPHGLHILPQTSEWLSEPPQKYLLTLGFRNKHIGKILERWSNKKLPISSDRKAPFCPLTEEETKRYWDYTGEKIMPVIDFIRSTKLTDNRCACSCGIERLHYASILGRLQRVEEQSQVINQAMAELATLPYLQDTSEKDVRMLRLLMADAMDTLEGRRSKKRVWNKIQKIGLIEDYLYQAEDNYLENKSQRIAKMEEMKRTQSTQQHYRNYRTIPYKPKSHGHTANKNITCK
ncbi:spermatogenesis-associated protein 16 isoform X1 [Pezoporus wallicus]|uniref:spermatogenesis-associated protein 16 isoform X1 n=1 Tax=Pezoporus wallicus TaxID=35540 RepID=UPI0025505395|nr:spermatogenesis-associated protein 16 isoform X1 [Pezoporus wallicus]XP_061308513.1 spermatogenesis-associated protein 16 isoform X1 [Pezoporus flaviventris]